MTKFLSLLEDFNKALIRFKEILQEKKTDIVRDSAIKRFEITFDLTWKTLKAFLEEHHNTSCASPQSCFREGFRVGVIDYDDSWIEMAKIRNKTVHSYNEALAEEIYAKLSNTLPIFEKLAKALKKSQ